MKPILSAAIFLMPFCSFAQDAKSVKHRLSENLYEQYTVSSSNKDQKDGLYLVYNDADKLITRGVYKDGKRSGTWRFYDDSNRIAQIYDYANAKLLFTNADSASYVKTDYLFEGDTKEDSHIPVKIGGANYAFLLLYSPKSIPANITATKSDIEVIYTFSVDEAGKTERIFATYTSNGITEKRKLTLRNQELLDFIPAQANGTPVKSVVVMSSTIYADKLVVAGTNNIVSH